MHELHETENWTENDKNPRPDRARSRIGGLGGVAMLTARQAVERRFTAWLERRYPGTRWSPEIDRPEPVEPTGAQPGRSGVPIEETDRRHIPADPAPDRE
jgi:hypothetical protein